MMLIGHNWPRGLLAVMAVALAMAGGSVFGENWGGGGYDGSENSGGDGGDASSSSSSSYSSSSSSSSSGSSESGNNNQGSNKSPSAKSDCAAAEKELKDFQQTYACNPPANNVSALIVDTSGGLIASGQANPAFVNGSCRCGTAQLQETFYNPLIFDGYSINYLCLNQARNGVDFTNFCACGSDGTCWKFQSAQEANDYVETTPIATVCNPDGSGCHALTTLFCVANITAAQLAPVSGPGANSASGTQPVVNCFTSGNGYGQGQNVGIETLYISCNGCPTAPVTQQQCQGTFNSAA